MQSFSNAYTFYFCCIRTWQNLIQNQAEGLSLCKDTIPSCSHKFTTHVIDIAIVKHRTHLGVVSHGSHIFSGTNEQLATAFVQLLAS